MRSREELLELIKALDNLFYQNLDKEFAYHHMRLLARELIAEFLGDSE